MDDQNSGKKMPREDSSLEALAKRSNLVIQVYDTLHDAIIYGKIKPGERLGQAAIAAQLGVSERTVREAFSRLVTRGLAEYEFYKGISVIELPFDEVVEIYKMRGIIEGHALELVAPKISREEIERMRELLPETKADITNTRKGQEKNRNFHWVYINATGSKMIKRELEGLWEMMFAYDLFYHTWNTEQIIQTDYDQHLAILNALEARDGKLAAEVNNQHMMSTIALLGNHFNNRDTDQPCELTDLRIFDHLEK